MSTSNSFFSSNKRSLAVSNEVMLQIELLNYSLPASTLQMELRLSESIDSVSRLQMEVLDESLHTVSTPHMSCMATICRIQYSKSQSYKWSCCMYHMIYHHQMNSPCCLQVESLKTATIYIMTSRHSFDLSPRIGILSDTIVRCFFEKICYGEF